MPSPAASPLTKRVFPAPRSPISAISVPGAPVPTPPGRPPRAASPLTKRVFPAPRSPISAISVPGAHAAPKRRPSAAVSSGDRVSTIIAGIGVPSRAARSPADPGPRPPLLGANRLDLRKTEEQLVVLAVREHVIEGRALVLAGEAPRLR